MQVGILAYACWNGAVGSDAISAMVDCPIVMRPSLCPHPRDGLHALGRRCQLMQQYRASTCHHIIDQRRKRCWHYLPSFMAILYNADMPSCS